MNTTLERQFILPDTSRLSFDSKKHAYTLDGTKLLTGVTSVIDGTSSKANLIDWAANMAVDHVYDFIKTLPDSFYAEHGRDIMAHPEEWLSAIKVALEEARTAYAKKRDKAGQKGTDTHALVEEYINYCLTLNEGKPLGDLVLNGNRLDGPDGIFMVPNAIRPFAAWALENVDRFIAAEQRLYSETHAVGGTCDFIAIVDGKLTIGDLKTFPKMWSADAFIQCGAYSLMFRELTGQQPVQSVIVKMCDPEDERIKKYGNKPFAVYPRYALAEDEEMFLTRLGMYRYNKAFVSPKE